MINSWGVGCKSTNRILSLDGQLALFCSEEAALEALDNWRNEGVLPENSEEPVGVFQCTVGFVS